MKAKLVKESLNLNLLKSKSHDEVLDKLKRSGKSIDEILVDSAKKGFLQGVKYALDNGADVHVENDKALREAVYDGNYDLVKLLLDHGADVHVRNNEPLIHAVDLSFVKIAKLLLDYGADIHINNDQPLNDAISYANFSMIKLLLDRGANVWNIEKDNLKRIKDNNHYKIERLLNLYM